MTTPLHVVERHTGRGTVRVNTGIGRNDYYISEAQYQYHLRAKRNEAIITCVVIALSALVTLVIAVSA